MGNGQIVDLVQKGSGDQYAIDEMPTKTIIDEHRLKNIENCKLDVDFQNCYKWCKINQ